MGNERSLKYMTNLEQACATSVYGAVSSEIEGKGGLYLEGASVVVQPCPRDADGVEYGFAEHAFDEQNEEKLWELSKGWVGVE